MENVFAAGTPLGTIGGNGEGLGPFANKTGNPLQSITTGISGVIGFLTICAAIWFLIQFLIGGISWISSAGDKTKLTEARDRLSNAFIGLLVVVAGWAILAIAGQFFGWTEILAPAGLLEKIKFQ
ncbi:hypothetical protein MUP56_02925 [Patescibacteria group bacterium]|nr:hypothetical protein [Patescibacteria group bacterium]